MRLSWSHKLFLKINFRLEKNQARDRFFVFCARGLIYILVFYAAIWLAVNFTGRELATKTIWFAGAVGTALFLSLLIGLLARQPRPESELPEVKQLIKTISSWKAFPSDHAAVSFLLSFLVLLSGGAIWEWAMPLGLAVLVAVARVYVGVHYPRDIIGGFVLASVIAGLYYLFLNLDRFRIF